MDVLTPETPAQLVDALAQCAAEHKSFEIAGQRTKTRLGGPIQADRRVCTERLTRVVEYNPADLTISVEAGLPYSDLVRIVAEKKQMVALDPPYGARATVGGVIASNGSGPRRRWHGTARDVVIGMQIAGIDGHLVQSGGMVVKNVAGLDMGKLQIGALGTLGAIATVNFKLLPLPVATRTFVLSRDTPGDIVAARDKLLESILQPLAIDLVNPAAAARLGLSGYCLLVEAGGNAALLDRYQRELAGYRVVDDGLWRRVASFTEDFLAQHDSGCVVRISTQIRELSAVLEKFNGPLLARAANGVSYAYCERPPQFMPPFKCVVEYAPDPRPEGLALWPQPGRDLEVMRRVKAMLDPENLSNPGRYYGCL